MKLHELGGDLRYISNLLDTIKSCHSEYKDLDEMSILKAIVFNETLRQVNGEYKVNKLFTIENDAEYSVQILDSYVKWDIHGMLQGAKFKNSILTGYAIKQLPFNVHMAIDSGLLKLTRVGGK